MAKRVQRNRSLWLIWKTQEELSVIHHADLNFKYSYCGLDLTELRALYACMPPEFNNDITGDKQKWLDNLRDKLRRTIETGQIRYQETNYEIYPTLKKRHQL